MTRIAKTKAPKTAPLSDQDIHLVLSDGSKRLLKQLFSNAIMALDSNKINRPMHLGIVAGHLRDIAHWLESTKDDEENDSEFNTGLNGDRSDHQLCDVLQEVPSDWKIPWTGFILSNHLLSSEEANIVGSWQAQR